MRVYHANFYRVLFAVRPDEKRFAVRFRAFAVRPGRTANPLFPVVIDIYYVATYHVETITFAKTCANHGKNKSSKFIKKTTHLDDMMIHNLVICLVQTQLRW
jgi:hypothetical protein